MAGTKPIRVLAADDSAVMRGFLRRLFERHAQRASYDLPEMELCGIVQDGAECLVEVLRLRPDVVLLDLEMPRMHGLDVLERLHVEEPGLPVIMCSAYTDSGARSTLEALALGAADYVMKPSQQSDPDAAIETLSAQLLPKIAVLARGVRRYEGVERRTRVRGLPRRDDPAPVEVVAIGVSTGGPSALEQVLPALAADFPVPVMIVQHMPKLFTGELAARLDRYCQLRVVEAKDGDVLRPGTIWLAPGDAHMEVATQMAAGSVKNVVRLHQQRSLNHCKPSVDYLFSSVARVYGATTLALVMTGMGADGLIGARRVHEAGGLVLAQDRATSAVWGMPGRVFDAGLVRMPLPLTSIATELTLRVGGGRDSRTQESSAAAEKEVLHGVL
jgi:two-component system, chemotaxis family, protein-glutamate methylesterase/glutaminase